jgi:hypothetical protein
VEGIVLLAVSKKPGAGGNVVMEASAVDQSESILSDAGLPMYGHGAPSFPCCCELCWRAIEDAEDDLWWHGYGNCVDVPDWVWREM